MPSSISARVVCDSVSRGGYRLTTVEATFPRFILAEVNTHRAFSRNSASSRAIPSSKMIARVIEDPFVPVYWGKNRPGMQAREEMALNEKEAATREWLAASHVAASFALELHEMGAHKQIVNRVIEPYLWHTCIISATEWENFFNQRCHPDAEPHMQMLAESIRHATRHSTPSMVDGLGWHLPYVQDDEIADLDLDIWTLKAISVARCARVSYLAHNGKRDVQSDIGLYLKLLNHSPRHSSPFEHVATPGAGTGNFAGWDQLRHLIAE